VHFEIDFCNFEGERKTLTVLLSAEEIAGLRSHPYPEIVYRAAALRHAYHALGPPGQRGGFLHTGPAGIRQVGVH
jgi:hypothetical protein